MAYNPEYYRGQGRLFIAPIVNGVTGKLRWVGNVPELEIGVEVDTEEHKESYSGQSLVDFVLTKETTTTLKTTLEEFTKENLALAFRGAAEVKKGGKVTDETGAAEIAAGDTWVLNHVGVSDVALTDSAGAKLTAEQYEIDEQFGRITLVSVDSLTAPLKATYNYAQSTEINMMQDAVDGYYMRFEGLNTAASNAPVLVEAYKVSLDPAAALSLIQDELASFELEGKVLAVDGKTVKITKL